MSPPTCNKAEVNLVMVCKSRPTGEARVVTFVDDIEGTISKRLFRHGILGDQEIGRFEVRNYRIGSHYVDEQGLKEGEG